MSTPHRKGHAARPFTARTGADPGAMHRSSQAANFSVLSLRGASKSFLIYRAAYCIFRSGRRSRRPTAWVREGRRGSAEAEISACSHASRGREAGQTSCSLSPLRASGSQQRECAQAEDGRFDRGSASAAAVCDVHRQRERDAEMTGACVARCIHSGDRHKRRALREAAARGRRGDDGGIHGHGVMGCGQREVHHLAFRAAVSIEISAGHVNWGAVVSCTVTSN